MNQVTMTMMPGWPEHLERKCAHCGLPGPRLICIELEASRVFVAICAQCGPALAEALMSWAHRGARSAPRPGEGPFPPTPEVVLMLRDQIARARTSDADRHRLELDAADHLEGLLDEIERLAVLNLEHHGDSIVADREKDDLEERADQLDELLRDIVSTVQTHETASTDIREWGCFKRANAYLLRERPAPAYRPDPRKATCAGGCGATKDELLVQGHRPGCKLAPMEPGERQGPRELLITALDGLKKLGHPDGGCGGGSCCAGARIVGEVRAALEKYMAIAP